MRNTLPAVALLVGLISPKVFGTEQAGPNPASLTPAGSQGVSLFTGAFTYSYPIAVPPGRRGVQPNLTLVYNSQAQNGWIGLGWNLGLGSVKRSTKNGIPTYDDSQDTFILQFQGATDQLVAVSTGNDGSAYTEYHAQIESAFRRVRYYAPSLWVVTTKDGTQYQMSGLGLNTLNSQYFYWGLTKQIDPLGNFMTVSYPSLSSATSTGTPGPSGEPTAITGDGAVVGYMPAGISYTGKCTTSACLAVSLSTTNQITFAYETRADTMTFSMEGVEEVISTRLKSITATSNGNAVRTYQLTYSSSIVGSSLLSGVALIGNDGVTTLSTTTFLYQSDSSYTVTLSTNYALPTDITKASFADVNGDGLPDIVRYQTGVGSGTWLNTGSGWSSSTTWISPVALLTSGGLDEGVRFGDLEGEGHDDIIQGKGTTRNAWLNNTSGWSVATSSWNPPAPIVDGSNVSSGTALVDINGDGLPDIYQGVSSSNGLNWVLKTWIDTGSGWVFSSTWVPPAYLYFAGNADEGTRFADLNGDSLIDIVGPDAHTGILQGWVNNGHGWSQANAWTPPTFMEKGLSFVDINGDGYPDIVQYVFYSTGSTVRTWLNSGSGGPQIWWKGGAAWLRNDAVGAGLSSLRPSSTLEYTDLNGDGVVDVIAISTNPASDQVYLGHIAPSNLLTTVNNGIGGVTQVTYGFSPPPVQPGLHLPPVTVVQSVTTSDGIGGDAAITSSYTFSGGLFDNARPYRAFLGFGQVIVTDAQGNYTKTYFLQNQNAINGVNLFAGFISEQDRYNQADNLMTRSTYTVSYSTPFSGIYFPFVLEADTLIGNKHAAVAFAYDAYGNLSQELDYGDVDLLGDERTIRASYSASTGPYLVGYPTLKQTILGNGATTLLAMTSFFYDVAYTQNPNLGELTKTQNWLSGGQDPVIISSYDVYGNVTDVYDALYNATGGSQGNHVHLTYDTTAFQYPLLVQQASGSALNFPAERYLYDPGTGKILSHVDVNGSTTSYSYDFFGRLSSVVGPADQISPSSPTLAYQYIVSTTAPQAIVSTARVVHGSSPTLATYTFFDGLGRQIETKVAGPSGNQIASGIVRFNNLGLAATSYAAMTVPSSSFYVAPASTAPRSVTTYDGLGRVIETIYPDNTSSTRAYEGWTETDTDPNGHSTVYHRDAYGHVVEIDEISTATFVTSYGYDLIGNLTSIVNSLRQTSAVGYDTLSRRTAMVDPQLGTWQYVYDPNGNLIQQIDSKNQAIIMTYDALNRRTFRIYPDSSTIGYSYDSGANARGMLSGVTDLSGSQAFTYDIVGNVLSKSRVIGTTTYLTSMNYDALGRQTSLIYPDSMTVNDVFDASLLGNVQLANGPIFAQLSYSTSAPARIGSVLYGNGASVQYSFTPSMFRLASLVTRSSTGTVLQNLGYQYDNVGNIAQITDGIGPMTQSFTYDSLDRLTLAVGPYGTNAYQYDSIGNFTLNSDDTYAFEGFDDASGITVMQGSAVVAPGRVGNGLSFNGLGLVSLDHSETAAPPATMSLSAWLRPGALNSGYVVSKSSSFYFPQIESDGSIDAKLELSTGEQIVHVSSKPVLNLWNYFVLTYDGANINVYVNGELLKTQSASGTINVSSEPILLGTGFVGTLDELSVLPRALTADEITQRYQLYPRLAINQPFTPNSVPSGMTAGVINTTYTFTFKAWDLNGSSISYQIDWGTGPYQTTDYVPSGTALQATHTWTTAGQYGVRVAAIDSSTFSVWSPMCNILIVGTSIQAAIDLDMLIGASANFATQSARTSKAVAGEALTGVSTSALTIAYQGFQGDVISPSAWSAKYLGPQGVGGVDASPPEDIPADNLVTVQYSTSAGDVGAIALILLEHGNTTFTDANGNLQVENGRWIAYDFENRPVRIVTQDQTLLQFAYDFDGNRTQQIVTSPGHGPQMTTYVGGIYEATASGATKYVMAGSLRVALQNSNGTTAYFLPDHLGSTSILLDSNEVAVQNLSYMPFGGTYQMSGSLDDDHKFTGQRLDRNSGLYYYVARYDDPARSRFISPDIFIQNVYDPQLLNRYVYTRNNPIVYIDPTGNSFWSNVGNFFKSNVGAIATQVVGGPLGMQIGAWELSRNKSGRNILAGEVFALTAAATIECAGCGAWSGALVGATSGEAIGGVSAGRSRGDILNGVLVGGSVGAVTGAVGGQIDPGDLGGWEGELLGAGKGAVLGAGGGFAAGYAGGRGSTRSILLGTAEGALLGGLLGGVEEYGRNTSLANATGLSLDNAWDTAINQGKSGLLRGLAADFVQYPEATYGLVAPIVGGVEVFAPEIKPYVQKQKFSYQPSWKFDPSSGN